MFQLLRQRSFAALTVTQFLGAFNDNVYKQFLLLLCLAPGVVWVQESGLAGSSGQALVGALFAFPFLVFSVFAGSLADRLSKRSILVACKVGEVVVMSLAGIALALESFELLLATLFLMGTQSAVFGPSKYGTIPELLPPRDLSRGNGLIQMTTFLAILGGTAVGGLLLDRFAASGVRPTALLIGLGLVGAVSALFVRRQPAADPTRSISWNPYVETRHHIRVLSGDRPLVLAVLAGGVFFLIATSLLYAINAYGAWLGLDGASTSIRLGVVALGIAAGSLVAGWVSGDRIETGLVPIGLLGMAASLAAVALAPTSLAWLTGCLAVAGISAGLFTVPVRALVQQRPSPKTKGAALGISELADFSGVFLGSGLFWLLDAGLGLEPPAMMLALAVGLAVFLAVALIYTSEYLVRLVLFLLMHTLYRIRVRGLENLPEREGALLVSNHVSFIDAFLIAATAPRPVRFLMYRGFFDLPLVGSFSRRMGAIPIAKGDSPRKLAESVREAADRMKKGELVCIFAEGAITRTGSMRAFGRGLERIARRARCSIVPVSLDRVWGSIFSFRGGRVFWKLPSRLPYPVGLQFGEPLPPDTPAWKVRNAVAAMGAQALEGRKGRLGALPYRFLRSAKKYARRPALVDSSGRSLSYRALLRATLALSHLLGRRLGPAQHVGVMLPASVAGALVNLALTLRGKVTVNLNLTLGDEELADPVAQAGISQVITSRRFLDKLERQAPLGEEGRAGPGETIFVEDLMQQISGGDKVAALLLSLLPGRLLARWMNPVRLATEPATVIFSSGSTARPKGVVLTHTNILSNVRAMSDVMQFSRDDRLLGVLPFFHSFGYTATLWAPLLNGAQAIYHPNPLDAKTIGRLAQEHGATIFLATPVFYQAYLRRIRPEQLATLRITMSGAQKLGAPLAQAWKERFGTELLEGYGATELSPVVSVNVPDAELLGSRQQGSKAGTIGLPLPGVAVRIVDPATGAERGPDEEGLLLVRGPNVMQGYLHDPERTAAVLQDGWYDTGDIARLDRDGFLIITDRLSRFSKIGGEMVPHGRVEEALHEVVEDLEGPDRPDEEGIQLAVTSLDDPDKGERLVVLHTRLPFERGALIEALRHSSLPKLFLPRAENFAEVEEIPKTGTGKIDLRGLKRLAAERLQRGGARSTKAD